MAFWRKDTVRTHGRDTLRHVRHLRRMREDVLPAAQLQDLRGVETALDAALHLGTRDEIAAATERAHDWLGRYAPPRRFSGLRENLEILAVAVGVAMACRTYFIQPFKIPTGSMQPTLNGILYESKDQPTVMDRLPFKLVKWMIWGEWYMEIRAGASGQASVAMDPASNSHYFVMVGNRRYRLPMQSAPLVMPGQYVTRGTLLWRGVRIAGDHVFVDRVRWNFQAPKRGQIIVFGTDQIPTLPPKTHYIKRLVGLPGEQISIQPPKLLANGAPVTEPETIARIARQAPGYEAGYVLIDPRTDTDPWITALRRPTDVIALNEDQFFACGDNTANSRDGRYWGAVPRKNLVGPAVIVYWPFSKRWGRTE